MTYKSVNTFIDDLFAFVIKMPIMHRLACLRDDVIFVIFLFQRYKYRTDYTRVNEFGQCEQPTEEMLKEAKEHAESGSKVSIPPVVSSSTSTETDKNTQERNNDIHSEEVVEMESKSGSNTLRRRGARDRK